MKVCSMFYSMRMKYNYGRFSNQTHVTSNSHEIFGFHFIICLRIQLSVLVGIYYTSSHLIMYIINHKLIFILFRGGEDEVGMIRKETFAPCGARNLANQEPRRMDTTWKETFVAQSSRDLTSRAARIMIKQRKQDYSPEMRMLIPRVNPNPWRTTGPLEKSMIMKDYCGYKPVMGRGTDAACMNKYLEKIGEDGMLIPRRVNINEFLPAGAPLLDFLATTLDREESWKFPPKEEIKFYQRARNVNYKLLDEVQVREIIIGETSVEEIKSITTWMWKQWEKDQRMNPTQIISLDNEEIKCTLYDIYRMAGVLDCNFPRIAAKDEELIQRPGLPEDRPCQLPTKVMFGNGLSYCVIISIKLARNSKGEYLLHRLQVQEEAVQLLEALPVCTGLGIRGDVTDIEFYFSLLSGRTVSLQGYIDLAALATLSGYNLMAKSMTPMGVQVIGQTLNKCSSTGDGKWAYGWSELPESLQVYGIADILFGHMCYSILATILLRDVFPDPEITCKFFNVPDQWFAVAWIQELIAWSLDGVEIHNVDFDKAATREDMILSLRYRYSSESSLMEESPAKVKIWCRLIGNWPSLTNGGCRYLLQARDKFLEQARVLKKSRFKWRLKVTMRELSNGFKAYARFGIPKEIIETCRFSDPAQFHYGLLRPGSCPIPPLYMSPEKVKPATIGKVVKGQERSMKSIVFEWARMNPHKIQKMFERLAGDKPFQKHFHGLYQGLRMIQRRIFNQEAVRIKELDNSFLDNVAGQLVEEEERARKAMEMYEARQERCKHLRNVLQDKDEEDQTLCFEELPRLPAWKPRRRGRKRGRSGTGREGKRRKLQDDPNTEQVQVQPGEIQGEPDQVQIQPGEIRTDPEQHYQETRRVHLVDPGEASEEGGGEDVVLIEMEDDESELAGINDPKPTCRKVIQDRRKKKGKKKKSTPAPVRSYDEIIESAVYRNSDDEYDLETYFSGELI